MTTTATWPAVSTDDEAMAALAGVRAGLDRLALAASAYGWLASHDGIDDGELAQLAIALHDYTIAVSGVQQRALHAVLRLANGRDAQPPATTGAKE